jgi:hypothetical protein
VNDGINGNPSIRFDGNDDHMLGNISLTQPITGFFVVNVSSESIIFDGRPQRALYLITLWSSTEIRLWSGSDESPLITPSGVVSAGQPHLTTTLTHHDDQSGIWVNGTEIIRGKTGSSSHEGYWIGNDDGPYATSGSGHYLDGDVGEILVYETRLNTSQRKEIEAYLRKRWDLS